MQEAAPIILQGETFQVLLENERIERRIAELGRKISEDYQDLDPVFVVVLNGAFMFAASLLKNVGIPCETDFIRLSSYKSRHSTGKIFEVMDMADSLEGRHVIVVEDIVDTGLSMRYLLNKLQHKNPKSVRIATLLFKREAITEIVPLDYIGFEIENRFVVGFGLDYSGFGRNYPDLYVLKKE